MASLYALTSLLAVVIIQCDWLGDSGILYDRFDVNLSLLPTLIYCAFITLSLIPFSLVYGENLKGFTNRSPWSMLALCSLLIIVAFINLYLVADSTMEILSGDLGSIRADRYQGIESPADVKAESMPFVIRYMTYFRFSTILALPLFFYYTCFEKKSKWFRLLLLFSSLTSPIAGIQGADRTEVVAFALMLVFSLVFFWQYLSHKLKRSLILAVIPMVGILATYVVMVTQSRFEKRGDGAIASVVQYGGQSYINFCYFWEHAKPQYIAPEREIPMISHYLLHIDSNMERRGERSGKQGFFISVFPSFIGDIYLDITFLGMVLWVCSFFLVSLLVIKSPRRKELDISEFLALFCLATVPVFGIFYYRYHNHQHTYMLILVAIIYILSKYKFIIGESETPKEAEAKI